MNCTDYDLRMARKEVVTIRKCLKCDKEFKSINQHRICGLCKQGSDWKELDKDDIYYEKPEVQCI